jgi:hypothetical protein
LGRPRLYQTCSAIEEEEVIRGATGTIRKSFRKYLSNVTRKHEIKELQKTAILDTAHILYKVLM